MALSWGLVQIGFQLTASFILSSFLIHHSYFNHSMLGNYLLYKWFVVQTPPPPPPPPPHWSLEFVIHHISSMTSSYFEVLSFVLLYLQILFKLIAVLCFYDCFCFSKLICKSMILLLPNSTYDSSYKSNTTSVF